MSGELNDILPEPISEENAAVIDELLKRKVKGAARLTVRLLHAFEERFGPEAREIVHELAENRQIEPRENPGDPKADLHAFCARLDRGCAGSHRWARVVDEPDRVAYRYTRCLWAEVYRELGEPDLGRILCAGDEPAVEAYHPQLGFQRTQVLMDGDPCCDHCFYVKKEG
jgi:hypothetical protein